MRGWFSGGRSAGVLSGRRCAHQALNLLLVGGGEGGSREQVPWRDKGRRVQRAMIHCRVCAGHVEGKALRSRTAWVQGWGILWSDDAALRSNVRRLIVG
jgi:hypothetical protein